MAAPKTVITIRLDGSNRDFVIPFEYLARKFVVITLIGTDRKTLTLGTDYRFTQRTVITTTQSWGPAQGYTLIELRRLTSATERLVDFSDGSVLRAYDLNISNVQSLHIAEEGRDIATDTIGVDNDGNLDARGRRIVNLADATQPGDAVTLNQNQQWAGSALNQADRALAEANRATSQATESTRQAGISTAQATESTRQAGLSLASANASAASQVTSTSSMNTAIANANAAKSWASSAEDVLVTPGLYSSYHYSRKSAASAAASAVSASQSFTDANRSKTEADRAKFEADKLGNANGLMETIEVASIVAGGVNWKPNMALVVQGTGDIYKKFGTVFKRYINTNDVDPTKILTGAVAGTAPSTAPSEVCWKGDAASLSVNVGTYSGALTIREKNLGLAQDQDPRVAPSIAFHWGGVSVRQLWMGADGVFRVGNQYNQNAADTLVIRNASNQIPLGAAGTYIQSDGDLIAPSRYTGGTLITELQKYRGRHYYKRELLADGSFGTLNVPIPLARALNDGELVTFTYWQYNFVLAPIIVWRGAQMSHDFGNGGVLNFTLSADGTSITVQTFTTNQGISKIYAMWIQMN